MYRMFKDTGSNLFTRLVVTTEFKCFTIGAEAKESGLLIKEVEATVGATSPS